LVKQQPHSISGSPHGLHESAFSGSTGHPVQEHALGSATPGSLVLPEQLLVGFACRDCCPHGMQVSFGVLLILGSRQVPLTNDQLERRTFAARQLLGALWTQKRKIYWCIKHPSMHCHCVATGGSVGPRKSVASHIARIPAWLVTRKAELKIEHMRVAVF